MTLPDTLTKLDEAATPGPWVIRHTDSIAHHFDGDPEDFEVVVHWASGTHPSNRNLIVALRNNLPRIIETLRWAERARVGLKEIANYEEEPGYWCNDCKRFTELYVSSGYEMCAECKGEAHGNEPTLDHYVAKARALLDDAPKGEG